MKKAYLIMAACLVFSALSGCSLNGHNGVSTNSSAAILWFVDTGIDVRNAQNRVYNIVQDPSGYLYYCSDVEGNLTPVLNADGSQANNTEIFK